MIDLLCFIVYSFGIGAFGYLTGYLIGMSK
jgi:hypothetical protein